MIGNDKLIPNTEEVSYTENQQLTAKEQNNNYKMPFSASYFIEKLHLQTHPEGGYYFQIHQDESAIKRVGLSDKFDGDRSFSTAIYYLLEKNNFSAFHRIKSDEVWHYYAGNTNVKIYEIKTNGELIIHKLGQILEEGDNFVVVIEKGSWFSAELGNQGHDKFALVGCTVAPGFDYKDFELINSKSLSEQFPQHLEVIKKLTRE